MPAPEKSAEALIDEASYMIDQINIGLEELPAGAERQEERLRRIEEIDAELDAQILALQIELESVPLSSTVEFLSLGRLTIGKV